MSTDIQDLTDEDIAAIKEMKRQKRQQRAQKVFDVVMGVDPVVLLLLGGLSLLMWSIACVTQLQTSEMMVMNAGKMPVQVEWGVITQPIQLLMGVVPAAFMGAYAYAWIIQTITFIWAYALEHALQELRRTNKHISKWFGIGSFLLICLNSWADFNNLPGNTQLIQGLVAVAIGGMSIIGLPVGVVLLKAGLSKLGAESKG